jgi:hypothetical protein
MNLEQFSWLVRQIPYGKKLPTAVYIAPTDTDLLREELAVTIRRAEVAAKPDSQWNLLKLHMDQLAITFLSYTNFEDDPHPTLAEATRSISTPARWFGQTIASGQILPFFIGKRPFYRLGTREPRNMPL